MRDNLNILINAPKKRRNRRIRKKRHKGGEQCPRQYQQPEQVRSKAEAKPPDCPFNPKSMEALTVPRAPGASLAASPRAPGVAVRAPASVVAVPRAPVRGAVVSGVPRVDVVPSGRPRDMLAMSKSLQSFSVPTSPISSSLSFFSSPGPRRGFFPSANR